MADRREFSSPSHTWQLFGLRVIFPKLHILVAKKVAKKSQSNCYTMCDLKQFGLSHLVKKRAEPLNFFCDSGSKRLVDSDQTCLICATISLEILKK